MGSTTLFQAVFINPEQVVRFLLCTRLIYSQLKLVMSIKATKAKTFKPMNVKDFSEILNLLYKP